MELLRIYQRLRDTMKFNGLHSRYNYPNTPSGLMDDLTFTDTLVKSLGYSIAAVEIAQRGVQSDYNLLEKMSQQTLTHLRILSETVSSYLTVGCLRNGGANNTSKEFTESQTRQLHQVFVGHPRMHSLNVLPIELDKLPPLLKQDPFIFLVECSSFLIPALRIDVHHMLRLCYLAEIVRVVLAFGYEGDMSAFDISLNAGTDDPAVLDGRHKTRYTPEQLQAFLAFYRAVLQTCRDAAGGSGGGSGSSSEPNVLNDIFDTNPVIDGKEFLSFLHNVVSSYALPFLRKCLVFMHIRHGIELPAPEDPVIYNAEPELLRLSRLLGLPSINDIFIS
ncbi:hypothetical protein LTS18_000396, partial [Coniosporium uncinatum]